MNLTGWARVQVVHPETARKWLRVGTLPVPAGRVGPGTILVNVEADTTGSAGVGVGLYARVSWHDQESSLDRQTARLAGWAAVAGHRVVRAGSEVGSGVNGARARVRRLLSDPKVTVVVEHRDRLGRVNTERVEAALSGTGRRLVVLDGGRGRRRSGAGHDRGAPRRCSPAGMAGGLPVTGW